MRDHYTSIRMAKIIRNGDNSKCWQDAEKLDLSSTAGGDAKSYIQSRTQFDNFFKKEKHVTTM